jgi:hypothetical protein
MNALALFSLNRTRGQKKSTGRTATIANIIDKEPELILALGDFSYKSSPNCWFDKIKDIGGITRITI